MGRTKFITVDGITLTQNGWARKLGVSSTCIAYRLKYHGTPLVITKKRSRYTAGQQIGQFLLLNRIGSHNRWAYWEVLCVKCNNVAKITTQKLSPSQKRLNSCASCRDIYLRQKKELREIDLRIRYRERQRQLLVTANGISLTTREWAEHYGVTAQAIYQRIKKYGTPLGKKGYKNELSKVS